MNAKPFFDTRFVLRPIVESTPADHWFGGKGDFEEATCIKCRNPLLLLVDVNCSDPVLRKESKGKFGTLGRLPLFICAQCYCCLTYKVEGKRIRVLTTRYGNDEPQPPYEDYPECFPRRPIRLDSLVPLAVPAAIKKWYANEEDLTGETLTPGERSALEEHFGHPMFVPRYLYHHQLGGEALLENWDWEVLECPNPDCTPSWWNRLRRRKQPMRFLAGILNDPPGGLPIVEPLNGETKKSWNFIVTFNFHICERCLTIAASPTSS